MLEQLTQSNKRFKAQKDGLFDIYNVRRRAIQDVIQELVQNRQETYVIGGTLFGSFSKGTSSYRSDVDVCLLYDTAAVAKRMEVSEVELFRYGAADIAKMLETATASGDTFFEPPLSVSVATKYMEIGQAMIRARVSKLRMPTPPQVIPVGMSEAVIDDSLKIILGKKGVQSPLSAITRTMALFHQSVTQGVFPYRRRVLSRLLRAGPRGQEAWQALIRETAIFEQTDKKILGKDDKSLRKEGAVEQLNVRYPWTLIAAIKLYAPELARTKN